MQISSELETFKKVAEKSIYNIDVITGQEWKYNKCFKSILIPLKLKKILSLALCHIELGIRVFLGRQKDAIILHGFSTELLILTYLFSLFRSKNIYCLTHHHIQQANYNILARIALHVYSRLGYSFIINEDAQILKNLGFDETQTNRHVTMLHPVIESSPEIFLNLENSVNSDHLVSSDRVKIGIVGKIRPEKKTYKTLSLLLSLKAKYNFCLIVGTDDFSGLAESINMSDDIVLINTSTRSGYLEALYKSDIIVLNYEESRYFYRCSGVAADAIGVKTYVVCPNFFMMRNQLYSPSQVGITYDSEGSLENAIDQAINLSISSHEENFRMHFEQRSINKISSDLIEKIETRIAENKP